MDVCTQAVNSFTVNGTYEPKDFEGFLNENLGFYALLPKGSFADTSNSSSSFIFYPVDKVFSDCNVVVYSSSFSMFYTPEYILEHDFDFRSDYHDDVCMTISPTKVDMGRYEYTVMELSYYSDCMLQTETYAVFAAGDKYWEIEASATDEYYETAINFMQELMSSIIVLD